MRLLIIIFSSIFIALSCYANHPLKSKKQPRKVISSKTSTVKTYSYTSKTSTSTDTDTQVKK